MRRLARTLGSCLVAAALVVAVDGAAPRQTMAEDGISRLGHVVVIYLENRSFDNLYGEFEGASGLKDAGERASQVDADGKPYAKLPQPYDARSRKPDTRIPADLPNKPFCINDYIPPDQETVDLVHRFYVEQTQIDDGKMDKFVLACDSRGMAMGYYHTAGLPLAQLAKEFTLCDHFFHGAFGGSFLNHIWFVAAAPPKWEKGEIPADWLTPVGPDGRWVLTFGKSGNPVMDKRATPDGYVVNTTQSENTPHDEREKHFLPSLTMPTIGDRLTEKGLDWAWYAGGWNDAVSGKIKSYEAPDAFQPHHQPFVYFANYADGKPAKAAHLKDETDFVAGAKEGKLPPVSFVKPVGINNEHPGYSDVIHSEKHVRELVDAVRSGPNWKDCAIVITYDEHGGFWDHVPPPKRDRWGPGSRVPAIVISPFAKRGFVDKTVYATESILATIEKRWDLKPLTDADAHAADMTPTFDFSGNR